MKSEFYLTKDEHYTLVFKKGISRANNLAVINVLPNGLKILRYGLVTSKKVGGAVVRNRVKRRLREIARRLPVKAGWDIVLVARPAMAGAKYQSIKEKIKELLAKTNILAEVMCCRIHKHPSCRCLHTDTRFKSFYNRFFIGGSCQTDCLGV